MILNTKLVAVMVALLFISAAVALAVGSYIVAFVCIIGLGLLSSHMKKYEKYYESELDELYPEDKENFTN